MKVVKIRTMEYESEGRSPQTALTKSLEEALLSALLNKGFLTGREYDLCRSRLRHGEQERKQ